MIGCLNIIVSTICNNAFDWLFLHRLKQMLYCCFWFSVFTSFKAFFVPLLVIGCFALFTLFSVPLFVSLLVNGCFTLFTLFFVPLFVSLLVIGYLTLFTLFCVPLFVSLLVIGCPYFIYIILCTILCIIACDWLFKHLSQHSTYHYSGWLPWHQLANLLPKSLAGNGACYWLDTIVNKWGFWWKQDDNIMLIMWPSYHDTAMDPETC